MSYRPGKFVWFELVTQDTKKANAFYTELLGWKTKPQKMGDMTYTMIENGEAGVAGMVPAPTDAVPSHWIAYCSVDDVDARAKDTVAAGGAIVQEAFDIPTIGRAALVTDPQGAHLFLFKGLEGDAEDKESTHGDWHWTELWTTDEGAALEYYTKTLGYEDKSMEMPDGTYHVLERDGVPRGGLMKSPAQGVPPNWLPYLHVDDIDATVSRAQKLGGKVQAEAQHVPGVGRFAILADPTGAAIGVITPEQA